VERIPAQGPTPEPEVSLSRYEGALCYRHEDRTWHPAGSASFRRAARRVLAGASPLAPPPPAPLIRSARTVRRGVFEDRVRQVLAWIAAGDCYQVNLTRSVHLDGAGDPWGAWRRLRRISGAAYGAWLALPDATILCNSPELFLQVDGREVSSYPIKGTRPRHADPVVDHAMAGELRRSEKERAELTMIVDLVRNDLGRIAIPGTVRWEPRRVTAHANVHHASQRVSARLVDDADAWTTLQATFPPGSVTGAPKVRACQRIAELEDGPRGVYCGAIGYVADGGNSAWNVAIRTAVWRGDAVRYHVGGGIVADSDPTAEWWETVHKGTILGRAFAGSPHPDVLPEDVPRGYCS
jgi:para-aminobenzoate synthetase component 1